MKDLLGEQESMSGTAQQVTGIADHRLIEGMNSQNAKEWKAKGRTGEKMT